MYGTGKICLCLSQSKTELRIFDDDKRVTLLYLLELRKAYLANETLHAAVMRHNVLAHTSVIGHFTTPEIHKLTCSIHCTTDYTEYYDCIKNIG